MISRSIVVLACLASFTVTSVASAEDPRKVRAEPVFREALRLHDAQRETEALSKYEEAYAIYPSPNVLFWIARCEELLDRKLDALRDYRQATSNPLFDPAFVDRGKERVRDLESQVSHVEIVGPDGMHAALDGAPVTAKGVDLLPGHHAVTATLADRVAQRDVVAEAGKVTQVDLTNDLAPRPTVAKADVSRTLVSPMEAPKPVVSRHGAGPYVLVGGLAVAGAASVVASIVFASASASSRHDADATGRTSNHACDQPASADCAHLDSINDSANRDRTLSLVTGAAGGVLLAGAALTGMVFFALPKRPEAEGPTQSIWIAPSVRPRSASLEAGLHF